MIFLSGGIFFIKVRYRALTSVVIVYSSIVFLVRGGVLFSCTTFLIHIKKPPVRDWWRYKGKKSIDKKRVSLPHHYVYNLIAGDL